MTRGVPDLAALVARELATPGRYHLVPYVVPPARTPFWLPVYDWLRDRVAWLWHALFDHIHPSRSAAAAIGFGLLALAVLVLAIVIVQVVAGFHIRRRPSGSAEALAAKADARAAYRLALDAAQRGAYGAAVRLLFSATLAAFDLEGVVAADRSATVGDLRRALRRRDARLVSPFDAIAAAFVTSAYAERPIAIGDWERANAAFRSIAPEASA